MEDENMCKLDKKLRKQKARSVKRRFWFVCLGMVLLFSGYVSTVMLQSSVNIEYGLGSKITAITYSLQIAVSFILAPAILRLFGAKKSLIFAESGYLVYVVLNFFSNKALLYIGAVAASFAEALFWIPIGISYVYFAKKYQPYTSKTEEECIMEFSGMSLGIFHFSAIFGNTIITLVLNVLKNADASLTSNSTETQIYTSQPTLVTRERENVSAALVYDRLEYCGASDCQDETVIQENIDQYVPSSIALYVVGGCFLLVMCIGMAIHVFLMPDMLPSSYNFKEDEKNNEDTETEKNSIKQVSNKSKSTSSPQQNGADFARQN